MGMGNQNSEILLSLSSTTTVVELRGQNLALRSKWDVTLVILPMIETIKLLLLKGSPLLPHPFLPYSPSQTEK